MPRNSTRLRVLATTILAGLTITDPALAIDVNDEAGLRNAIFDIRDGNTGGDTTINITGANPDFTGTLTL